MKPSLSQWINQSVTTGLLRSVHKYLKVYLYRPEPFNPSSCEIIVLRKKLKYKQKTIPIFTNREAGKTQILQDAEYLNVCFKFFLMSKSSKKKGFWVLKFLRYALGPEVSSKRGSGSWPMAETETDQHRNLLNESCDAYIPDNLQWPYRSILLCLPYLLGRGQDSPSYHKIKPLKFHCKQTGLKLLEFSLILMDY